MRLFQYSITSILLVLSSVLCIAQSNCNNTIPVLDCPLDNDVCENEIINSSLLISSDLPTIEYAIVNEDSLAASGTGPAIVGVDQDGIFMPSDYGLASGGNFSVIPVAYDLAQIQETIDDILTGSVVVIFFNISCCDLAIQGGSDICGPLNAAGIFSGADVTSLQDASALFAPADSSFTVEELVANLEAVNASLADPNTPTECGGGDVFCYAYGNQCTYSVTPNSLVLSTTHNIDESLEAVDIINSSSTVQNPSVVEYSASMCIELNPSFETILGAEFLAQIDNPCN